MYLQWYNYIKQYSPFINTTFLSGTRSSKVLYSYLPYVTYPTHLIILDFTTFTTFVKSNHYEALH